MTNGEIMEGIEMEPEVTPDFVVLDLDRTLIDNDVLVDIIRKSLTSFGMTQAQITELSENEKDNKGNSFDYLGAMLAIAPNLNLTKIVESIKNHPDFTSILVGGAKELLAALRDKNIAHGILTYGSNPDWQYMKTDILRTLCGIEEEELVAAVTKTEGKATYIEESWYDSDKKMFLVPEELSGMPGGLWVRRIHIFDDKDINLEISGTVPIEVYPIVAANANSLRLHTSNLMNHISDVEAA